MEHVVDDTNPFASLSIEPLSVRRRARTMLEFPSGWWFLAIAGASYPLGLVWYAVLAASFEARFDGLWQLFGRTLVAWIAHFLAAIMITPFARPVERRFVERGKIVRRTGVTRFAIMSLLFAVAMFFWSIVGLVVVESMTPSTAATSVLLAVLCAPFTIFFSVYATVLTLPVSWPLAMLSLAVLRRIDASRRILCSPLTKLAPAMPFGGNLGQRAAGAGK